MPRRPLVFLLLSLCLVWQSAFAVLGLVPSEAHSDLAKHAAMHLFDESHHHHDGDFHPADSPEALQHIQDDGLLNLAAVMPALPVLSRHASWTTSCRLPPVRALAPPFIEGPERPPRTIA